MPLPYTMSRNHVNPQGLQLHGGIELHGGHRVQAHLRRLHGVLLGAAGGEDVQLALPGLIVDQPLLLQIAAHGPGHLLGGVHQLQLGIQAVDVLLHQGIVGAAQNAALHLLLVDQLLQVLSKVIVNGGLSGGIAHVALHQVGQVGAAMADDLLIRRHLSDQIGVAVGGGGKAGGDHAHLMGGQLGHRVRASLDHAEHRTAHFIPVLVDEAGDGIAGHQQRLHAVVLHKA